MRRAIWALPVAATLIVLLALGFRHDPNAVTSPLINRPAPAFALTSDRGTTISLAGLRGHPVVLNFWATWCTSCLAEHENLVALWRAFGPIGVRFVSVSFQDSASAARDFLRQHGGDWPDLEDPGSATAIDYGVSGPPETFLIDDRGYVRFKATGAVADGGAVSAQQFAQEIRRVLAQRHHSVGSA